MKRIKVFFQGKTGTDIWAGLGKLKRVAEKYNEKVGGIVKACGFLDFQQIRRAIKLVKNSRTKIT